MAANKTYAVVSGGVAAAIAVIVVAMAYTGGIPAESDQLPAEPMMQDKDKIKIFASFYPYYEFAKNVAGSQATVEQYMPSGVEAHDWEPRAGDIVLLESTDVFVYNGLGMEPYVDQIIDSGDYEHIVFVNASKDVKLLKPAEPVMRSHVEEFSKEILEVVEEFDEGHMTESQTVEAIEEILHQHEDDGHYHSDLIENIEKLLHEIEDGDIGGLDGIEEIHHMLSEYKPDNEAGHDEEHERDEHEAGHDEEHERDEHEAGHDEEHERDEHGHTHSFEYDPHIWLDPVLVKQQVNNIKDALVQADPTNAELYQQNAASYNAKLDAYDAKVRSELSSCKNDTVVAFHNAFSYFAERYDLAIFSITGISPEAETSASELAKFVDFVKDNDIEVIFAEELVDPRLAEVIAEEAGAQVMILSPLEALTPEESSSGVTFLEKMEQNLEGLKVALNCQ